MLSVAQKFDHIMAVGEWNGVEGKSYYLLKNGKKFGEDSLYVFDMAYACESEGFIKFKDPETDLVGMFNRQGQIAIPAEYSELTQVKNGVFAGLKGAHKEYWDDHDHSGCNHWSWAGGADCLLDTTNTVLVEGFEYKRELNFYSLKISDVENTHPARVNFKGLDNRYYSFIDNEKLFELFFEQLLTNISEEKIMEVAYEQIVDFGKDGWMATPKQEYFAENMNVILRRLQSIKSDGLDYFFSLETFVSLPNELHPILDHTRDNCGDIDIAKHPIFNVVVTNRDKEGNFSHQDHYTFVKLNERFELINITIRNK